jgi:cobalamin biosynthesis Mg chelatase CobN
VKRRIPVFLLMCVVSLMCAATARADLLTTILTDYANDNQIDPCRYSPKVLSQLKQLISNDLDSYSDLGAAVDDALARRAQGVCKKGAKPQSSSAAQSGTGAVTPPASSGGGGGSSSSGTAPQAPVAPGKTAPAQPAPTPAAQPTAAPAVVATGNQILTAARTTEPSTDAPFPVLALAILAAILALGGLTVGLFRWRAWEPAWTGRFRHAAGEAGWRASSTWAEFSDFVRFGR